jgi:predicted RNA-binding protein with PIN domain
MTIIDGQNLLWALHETFDDREITSEIELTRKLSRYFASAGEEGQIVFDGAGPADTSEFEAIANPEVFFSGFRQDADTIIEEKIKASTAPTRLTVVSSDRRIRKAAAARKAKGVKSEEFWRTAVSELAKKKPAQREPDAKTQGLSTGETDQWLEFFGLDP